MRFAPSDTADHINLNKIFQRPSSLEERVLSRNRKRASLCENFALAVFSTFQQNRPIADMQHAYSITSSASASNLECKCASSALAALQIEVSGNGRESAH
jgi:hypothetical protein